MTTNDFIKMFNYDGGGPSWIDIAKQAKNIEDNTFLKNKAIEFLDTNQKMLKVKGEFQQELEKINFPEWD